MRSWLRVRVINLSQTLKLKLLSQKNLIKTNKMKSSNIILGFIFLAVLFLPSCATAPPDPAGTNTISLNYTANAYIILYQGVEEGPDQSWPYVQILLRIFDASMNFGFTAIRSMDPDIISYLIYNNTGGEMVNLGNVTGLGAITDKPSSG